MADRTVYVDGTTSGTPGTNGARYASLQAAMTGESGAAPDLVAGAAILHVECSVFSGNAADTTAATVNGFTTDATHYVHIYTASSSRHSGTWDVTKYRLEVSNAYALTINNNYVRVDGFQARITAVAQNDLACISFVGQDPGAISHVSNTITRCSPGDAFRQMGIWVVDSDVTVYIWNWIDYGHPSVVSVYNSSLMAELGAVYCYSSTLIGGFYGVFVGTGVTVNAKNVYASTNDSGGGGLAFKVDGTLNQTTTASSDATATGTSLDNIAVDTTNFTNVTAGSENFHIPTGSALKDVGTDTSGEASPLNFTTDIDGVARSGTWDIGADEFFVAVGNDAKIVIRKS